MTQENCVSGVTPSSRVEEMTLIWYLETANNASKTYVDNVIAHNDCGSGEQSSSCLIRRGQREEGLYSRLKRKSKH